MVNDKILMNILAFFLRLIQVKQRALQLLIPTFNRVRQLFYMGMIKLLFFSMLCISYFSLSQFKKKFQLNR